jgi:aryl-phospho-beta-D-glucosidase BglC (GH1 family)
MITGWLHTEAGGINVYDSGGNVVPLRGVDVDGLDFGTGNPTSSPDSCGKGWGITTTSFTDVAAWGFNSVRIPISWENLEPTAPTLASNGTWIHHWNTAYLSELDYVVKEFGQTHIAVMFDFAQVDVSAAFQQAPEKVQGGECEGWGNPTWLYPAITSPTTTQELAAAMCNFFGDVSVVGNSAPSPIEAMEAAEQMLASRYAANPTVVGIDMFNEPWFSSTCGSTAYEGGLLTGFYTKMGDAISAANPRLLLIFEDSTPGLMPSAPIMSSPPAVANAMYEYHIYTSDWKTGEPYVQAFLGNAKSWGVPIWMGEFDAFEAGCTGVSCVVDPNWQVDTQSLLAFCDSNGINWAYFSYYSLGTSIQTPVPHSEILAVLQSAL